MGVGVVCRILDRIRWSCAEPESQGIVIVSEATLSPDWKNREGEGCIKGVGSEFPFLAAMDECGS